MPAPKESSYMFIEFKSVYKSSKIPTALSSDFRRPNNQVINLRVVLRVTDTLQSTEDSVMFALPCIHTA